MPLKIATIVCNGESIESGELRDLCRRSVIVVAANGGIGHLKRLSITPDLYVGDRDSLPPDTDLDRDAKSSISYSPDKDKSDAELAVEAICDRGIDRIVMTCATGRRLDHLYANLSIAAGFPGRVFIYDGRMSCFAVTSEVGPAHLVTSPGTLFSVLPFGDRVDGLTIEGAKWSLRNGTMVAGSVGLSNEALDDEVIVCVKSGTLLVFAAIDDCNISLSKRSISNE